MSPYSLLTISGYILYLILTTLCPGVFFQDWALNTSTLVTLFPLFRLWDFLMNYPFQNDLIWKDLIIGKFQGKFKSVQFLLGEWGYALPFEALSLIWKWKALFLLHWKGCFYSIFNVLKIHHSMWTLTYLMLCKPCTYSFFLMKMWL